METAMWRSTGVVAIPKDEKLDFKLGFSGI
jgi:hypothetical protein